MIEYEGGYWMIKDYSVGFEIRDPSSGTLYWTVQEGDLILELVTIIHHEEVCIIPGAVTGFRKYDIPDEIQTQLMFLDN